MQRMQRKEQKDWASQSRRYKINYFGALRDLYNTTTTTSITDDEAKHDVNELGSVSGKAGYEGKSQDSSC